MAAEISLPNQNQKRLPTVPIGSDVPIPGHGTFATAESCMLHQSLLGNSCPFRAQFLVTKGSLKTDDLFHIPISFRTSDGQNRQRVWDVAQLVECLPSVPDTLGYIHCKNKCVGEHL